MALPDSEMLARLRAIYDDVVDPTGPTSFNPPEYTFSTPPSAPSGPPAQVYAGGGAVETLGGPNEDDYGAGRFTRTPAERRENRLRRIDQLPAYDPSQDEWSHLQRHNYNPLSYGMEAVARFDRRLGAAREGENGWTWRDLWDNVISPDPRFRDENGLPGAAADAISIGSQIMAPGVSKALAWGAPLVYGLGREAVREATGYAGGGKVARLIKEVGKKYGNYQASRVERAADETNLERITPRGLREMFNPSEPRLFMNIPPGDFQDYAARIPPSAAEMTPYPRSHNVPGEGRLPDAEKTQDWYLDRLTDFMDKRGMYSAPELIIGQHAPDLPRVLEHEGRHRMMAMDRLGDPLSLVQMKLYGKRPFDWNQLDPEERVDWLQQNYFPRGSGSMVVPQERVTPRALYAEPYAGGGVVKKGRDLLRLYKSIWDKPISIAVDESVVPRIVADGRFKSQFETGSSNGIMDNDFRADFERDAFGHPLDLPREQRPIYGHVADRNTLNSAGGYGNWNVVLSEDVKPRSTFYFGDSLGQVNAGFGPYKFSDGAGSAAHRNRFRSWLHEVDKNDPNFMSGLPPTFGDLLNRSWATTPGGYVEAQVHGGLPWSDVTAMVAKRDLGARSAYNSELGIDAAGDRAMKMADQTGVPVYGKFGPSRRELTPTEFEEFVRTGIRPDPEPRWLRANPGMKWEDIGTDELKGIGYAGGGKVLSLIERLAGGKPKEVKLPGGATMPAYPIREFEEIAEQFARKHGNEYPITDFPKLDEDRARKIAEAYELMQHAPSDPRVKRAYDALIDETMDQYRALEGTGARFEFLKPGEADPYARSPSLGYLDLIENGRLKVFPTEQGYGTQTDIMDNPLLRKVGRVGDLEDATANDAFRVVHDALGHFGPGNPFFRAPGEERAWLAHSRAYSPDAVPAATSETRGQNSWVNFGPQAARNKGASGADTIYADQKAGLLPEWMYDPDASGPYPIDLDWERAKRSAARTTKETFGYRDGGKVLKGAKRFLIDPIRESYSGVYKDPDKLLSEAREHIVPDPGKEGPMYRLFGHTRQSLDELSQGNRDLDSIQPFLGREHPFTLSGENDVIGQLMTRRNQNRLVNAIGEALDDPDLRATRSWYEMSPLWDRASEVGVGDRGIRGLNTRMAVMSAGSDPRTEINRGFHANWLANEGRIDDFVRYGGWAEDDRGRDFPDELRSLMGHSYHGTAQVPNLLDYETTGRLWGSKHKVPTYTAATDPKDPYWQRPIADSHFSRIVGYPDVSTASTDAVRRGVMPNTAYSQFVPWFNEKVAGELDMRPRDAQALLWNLGGPQTGVRYIGPPKLEMIADYMDAVARARQIAPEDARDMLLRGEIGGAPGVTTGSGYAAGGRVDDDFALYQTAFYKEGGNVVPYKEDDDFLGYLSMHYGV